MTQALRLVLVALFLLPWGLSFAEERPFAHPEVAAEAEQLEASLAKLWSPEGRNLAGWRRLGDQAQKAGDPRKAMQAYGAALALDDTDAGLWLALARAIAGVTAVNDEERQTLLTNTTGAAYAAYQKSKSDDVRAAALVVLAETLKQRQYWRPALDAYKSSLSLRDVTSVREAYDQLRAEQGFRITDYSVDSDAISPRLCVQFSEQLALGQVDFAKFVSVGGADPTAVTREDYQLCIEGMQHGQRYNVQIRAGLPSAIGEDLAKTADLGIYVRDRSPQARFTGKSYVLPNKGQQGIPVVTVNTEKVDIEIYRIGDRSLARTVLDGDIASQLSGGQLEDIKQRHGAAVWHGSLPVKQELNQEVTTAFPVSEALPDLAPGVYVMAATAQGAKLNEWDARATQWFIVSDLGLTALTGEDGVNGFVRSLASAEAKAGVKIKLIARNNEVLGEATSDARGYVRFEAGLTRGEGGAAPAVLIAESQEGDYAFLDLTSAAFDLTDRGVAGRQAPGPLDAYLFAERGVYRPGEEVHLTSLLRTAHGEAAPGIPLTLVLSRPDGVEQQSMVVKDQGLGGFSQSVAIAPTAMTGTWRARLYADPKGQPIGEASFLVEDYVPERLAFELKPVSPAFEPGKPATVRIDGRYLYGPPAAGLAVEGEVVVQPSLSGLAGYEGYRFGMADETVSPVRAELAGLPGTDAEGKAELPITLPPLPRTGRLLEARVLLRLKEPSGRTIERNVVLPVLPESSVIGVRPQSEGVVDRGGVAAFDVVLLGRDGKPEAMKGATWQVLKVERQYQWYGQNGSWRYEPVTYTNKVLDGTVDIEAGQPAHISVPVQWGEYVLEVHGAGAGGPATSYAFYAGWYGGEKADSPEVLQIGTDRGDYKVGDTVKLNIVPDGAGRAVIAVLRDGLIAMQEVEVPAGGGSFDIKVDEAMAPGAYVTAMLYRPMDIAAKRMPSRSIGVKWVPVDSASRRVGISLGLPAKIGSGEQLRVPVKLAGLAAGEEARVVVAAVDVGILNLTRYATPDPESWYFGQRRLGTEIRDLYGRLIDGMRAEKGTARSGGDGGGMEAIGGLPTVTPVALYSGILTVGPDGSAEATFQLPDFNGSLRVMAVAWTKTSLGHAEQEVIVRDPVAVLVSGPRFLTLGDQAELIFDMHNVEGAAGPYQVSVEESDDSGRKERTLDAAVDLGQGERKLQKVALQAKRLGPINYAVSLTGPGGIAISRSFALEVQAPAGDVKRSILVTLAPRSGKLTVGADALADLIPERSQVTVAVGPAAGLDVPGLLAQLDRYPYGCAEQTTSRALPLLYLNQVAVAAGLGTEKEARERVQKAVDRLFEMQDSAGAFGLWGPGNTDLWLSAYVTDFLTRAREQGYAVPAVGFTQALDRLQNSVSYASDFEKGGEEIAYALYVLARNGRAPIGDLRYYADTRLDRFATPLAKAQIGAALAMYGDKARAEQAFDTALADYEQEVDDPARRDYGSSLRDGAAALTLISETGVRKDRAVRLTEMISKSRLGRTYTSTQEQAWMLLAARGLIEQAKSLELTVSGEKHTGGLARVLTAADLAKGPFVVSNESEQDVQAVVSVTGEALTPEPATAKGLTLARSYYRLDGTRMVPGTGGRLDLKQNDRLVVVLKLAPADGNTGRVLVVDRLAAGFEVENPRLVEGGSVAGLPWLQKLGNPEHTEFRDDRFVAALDLGAAPAGGEGEGEAAPAEAAGTEAAPEDADPAGTVTLAYVVRAVNPGAYLLPAATIEDMYRPERFARTEAGRLTVSAE